MSFSSLLAWRRMASLWLLAVLPVAAHASGLTFAFNSPSAVAVTQSGYAAAGTATLTLNFAPAAGTQLTVVKNTGTTFISGQFSNLAQGAEISLPYGGTSYEFVANYYGGHSGRDLVLVWANNAPYSVGWAAIANTAQPMAGFNTTKTVLATSAGFEHNLVLVSDGSILAQGYNGHGQLGNGATSANYQYDLAAVSQAVGSALHGKTVVAVAAGYDFSLALCSDGTVAAWGDNSSGQLGNGTTTDSDLPVAVSNGGGSALQGKTVVAIRAGTYHSLALCSDGTLVSWGDNTDGELGDGTTNNASVPIAVSRASLQSDLAGRTVVDFSCSGYHNLALCSDGSVVAWGLNNSGQLGQVNVLSNVSSTTGPAYDTVSIGGTAVLQVFAGFETTTTYTYTTERNFPGLVNTESALYGKTVVQVATGYAHSVALCSDGTVVAWGDNSAGEIGINNTTEQDVPATVSSGTALSGKTVIAIGAGQNFSTAYCSDGTAVAWGDNTYGEIGDGTKTNRLVPTAVSTGTLPAGAVVMRMDNGGDTISTGLSVGMPVAPAFAVLGNGAAVSSGAAPATENGTNFGSTAVGTSAVETFTIANNGTGALQLTGTPLVSVGGTNASDFVVTTEPAAAVVNSQTTTFQVTFSPSANGTRTATLTILNDAAGSSPFVIKVSGTGQSPALGVSGNGVAISRGATVATAANGSDFGVSAIGTPVARTFTISNTGPAALTLGAGAVTIAGAGASAFSVTAQPSSPVAATSGTTTFQITFNPAGVGILSQATVSIASNDPASPFTFAIQGAGPAPAMAVTGNSNAVASGSTTPSTTNGTDFGGSAVETPVTQTYTITNSGLATLNLTGTPLVAISGANASDFTVTVTPATALASGGATTTFTVRFNPGALGVRSATLSLANNDNRNNPYTFAIQGEGIQVLAGTITSASSPVITANGYYASGGNLNLTLGYAPTPPTTLTIIHNTGSSAIVGTFNNVPIGATVTLAYNGTNYTFIANYYGGAGNDLVLTEIAPRTASVVWNSGVGPEGSIGHDSAGNIYLPGNGSSVLEFDTNGNSVATITTPSSVSAVAVDENNTLFVICSSGIYKYVSGSFVAVISGYVGDLGLAARGGYIYYTNDSAVTKASYSGTVAWTVNLTGAIGVTVDSQGQVYAGYNGASGLTSAYGIAAYSSSGTYLRSWAVLTPAGQGPSIYGLAIDASDHIYGVSPNNGYVQEYSTTGAPVAFWYGLSYACGVTVDASYNVFVSSDREQVVKFAPAPTAVPDSYSVTENSVLSVLAASGVLANDQGTGLSASLVTGPSNGTLTLNADGSFSYTPTPGFFGTDTFVYEAANGSGAAEYPATVTITVSAVGSSSPTLALASSAIAVAENSGAYAGGSGFAQFSPGLVAGVSQTLMDYSVSATNTSLFSVQPAVDAQGNLTFTVAAGITGSATVTLTGQDSGGTASGRVDTVTATFTITVAAPTTAPSVTLAENNMTVLASAGAQSLSGFATFALGPTGDTGLSLTGYTVTAGNTSLFTVQPAIDTSGNLTFTPAAGLSGSTTITVVAADNGSSANGGVNQSTATFTITTVATAANQFIVTNNLDSGPGSLRAAILAANAAGGAATIVMDGNLGTITPASALPAISGTVALDAASGDTLSGTLLVGSGGTLNLNGTTLAGAAVTVESGGILEGNESFGGPLEVQSGGIVSPGNSPGQVTADGVILDGGGTYLWDIADAGGNSGTAMDLITTTGTLQINASSSNQVTLKLRTLTSSSTPGAMANFNPTQSYSWTLVQCSSTGQPPPAPALAGAITGFNANEFVLDLSQVANSLQGGRFELHASASQLVLVFVPDVAATAVADSYSMVQANTLTVATANGVMSNDVDPMLNGQTVSLVSGPAHGNTVTLNADGSFTYTPAASFYGTDSFTYSESDGFLTSNPATVTITVTARPVDTLPTTQTVTVNTIASFTGSNAISVADPSGLSVTAVLSVSHGTLAVTSTSGLTLADGSSGATLSLSGSVANVTAALATLTYTPSTNYVGSDTLAMTTTDSASNPNLGNSSLALTVARVSPVISWPAFNALTYGTALSAGQLDAIAGAGGTFTYSVGGTVLSAGTVLPAGTYSIVAYFTPTNTALYAYALLTQQLVIAPASQSITFPAFTPVQGSATTLGATASSGLPVTYTLVSGNAGLSGSVLTVNDLNPVTVQASQAGDANHLAATPVNLTVTALTNQTRSYFGSFGTAGTSSVGSSKVQAMATGTSSIAGSVAAGGASGTLIGYLSSLSAGFVANFAIAANGSFSVTTTALTGSGSGQPLTFTGTVAGTTITGTISQLGLPFSLTVDPSVGVTAAEAGYYQGLALDAANGATYSVVGTQGEAYILVISPLVVSSGTGTVASNGTFSVQGLNSTTITGSVNSTTSTISGTVSVGGMSSTFAGVSASTTPTDRLFNLSARSLVTPSSPLTAGFIVSGTTSKTVLLRGIGPSLAQFGVTGTLAHPVLSLFSSTGVVLATNAGWGGSAALSQDFSAVGAFALAATSADDAMQTTLTPGNYTIQVSDGAADAGGMALAEMYDASLDPTGVTQKLVNISALGRIGVGTSQVLTAGFIVSGNTPKTLLIRGVGPTLASFGVTGTVPDPVLAVMDQSGNLLAANNDWGTPEPLTLSQSTASASTLSAAASATGAFPLNSGSKDAALIVTLAPGAYSALVTDGTGSTGAALVEIYEIPGQ